MLDQKVERPYVIPEISLGERLLKRFKVAQEKRKQFESIWQTVSNYVLPYRGGFYSINDSGSIAPYDRNVAVYDDTATNALVKASSALYSYTANPATQWFHFKLKAMKKSKKSMSGAFSVRALMQNRDVRNWLEETEETVAHYINANSQEGMHAIAQELLAYSTSALYIIEDPFSEHILTIQPIALRDLYILNGASGAPEEVYRSVLLTNEQIVNQFAPRGGQIPDDVIKALQTDPLKERVVIHAVYPRTTFDPRQPDNLNMPFASVWIDYTTKKVIYESGFDEMPYAIARINVPAGFVYGFSPAMNIRHTIQSLNKLVRQKLNAGDLALTPAMNVPLDTYVNPLSLKPAALNYHEPDSPYRAEPMHTVGNFQINTETITDARNQVKQGMLIDLIEQTNKDNTYQAMQEQLLQLKLMSPWQGGIEKHCLRPLVIRVFNILQRRGGILPEPPAQLAQAMKDGSVKIQIDYDSPLARAQQHFKTTAIEQVMAFSMPLAQVGSLETINIERMIKLYVELIGAPSAILYTDKETKAMMRAQQEQAMKDHQMQQQMAQAQQMKDQASSMKDMAQAASTMGAGGMGAQSGAIPSGMGGM